MTPSTFARGRLRAGSLISRRDVRAALPAAVCEQDRHERGQQHVNRRAAARRRPTRSKWLAGAAPRPNASATSATMPATFAAISTLLVRVPARTPTTLIAVSATSADAAAAPHARRTERHERSIDVAREQDRHGRQRSAVDDEQQRDAVEKADDRMVGTLEVDVLAADIGKPRRELGPDERAHERDGAAERPHEQNQRPACRRRARHSTGSRRCRRRRCRPPPPPPHRLAPARAGRNLE